MSGQEVEHFGSEASGGAADVLCDLSHSLIVSEFYGFILFAQGDEIILDVLHAHNNRLEIRLRHLLDQVIDDVDHITGLSDRLLLFDFENLLNDVHDKTLS